MVKEFNEHMEKPMKWGNAVSMFAVGIAVIGVIFIGSIKLMAEAVLTQPKENSKNIAELQTKQAVQEECIETLKSDVADIKDSNKEIQKDIKDILKAVK